MDDYISRQKMLEMLDSILYEIAEGDGYQYEKWHEYVQIMPSAQPKHHFCRECKYVKYYGNVDKYGNVDSYWHCLNWDGGTDEEGFCYEWERKNDE